MSQDEEMQENESENNIELTKEFKTKLAHNECQYCTMVQILALLKNDEQKGTKDIENGVVKSTKDYLNEFNRYGVSQTSSDIPVKIKNYLKAGNKFTELEMTLLMDLAPTTPEEAFYLIPSLKTKLTEDEMNEYLSKLNKEIINNS